MNIAPRMTAEDARTAATFDALMRAAAEPGRIWPLPGGDPALIAEALLDREVSVHAADPELAMRIAPLGALAADKEAADYVFAPARADLPSQLRAGTLADPDLGAALIAPAVFGRGTALRLTGPGIALARDVAVDGIPAAFWAARAAALRYPRGFDIFLHDGASVIGLPRSTRIEVF